ncbi:MAG TPA: hypothetical protein VHF69_00865 [Candidatus Synoicihabitans sp.]|nr:hypothetical protein [Candidatus Synoicihabitans sp.]
MNPLVAALDIIASLLGIARKRNDAAQAPEMKAAARGKTDAEIKGSAGNAVAKRDLNEIRKRLSE